MVYPGKVVYLETDVPHPPRVRQATDANQIPMRSILRSPLYLLSLAPLLCLSGGVGCGQPPSQTTITISGSAVGAEAEILDRQIQRFMRLHPDIRVEQLPTPDAADQRHQLYVQWLNAHTPQPDILQLDVIWTPEFAAAGWLLPLDRFAPDVENFFPSAIEANRWQDSLYALPWFIDVGMLYWRTDLLEKPPKTFSELRLMAKEAKEKHGLSYGFVWQGARYEGLVTVFLEHVGGFGGAILNEEGNVTVAEPPAQKALRYMWESIYRDGIVPREVLTWQEEQTRFAFQNGEAVFMRNWPYAYPLMQDPERSRVAGRFAVAPMPSEGGAPTAALGGAQLAINAHSAHPEEAYKLLKYLTAPEQMRERARVAGQYPPRPALYEEEALAEALPIPPEEIKEIIDRAKARPVTPVYTELSRRLQVHLHSALTGQEEPAAALKETAREMQTTLARTGLAENGAPPEGRSGLFVIAALLLLALLVFLGLRLWRKRPTKRSPSQAREERLAWYMASPALLVIAAIALFPLLWVIWESFHAHDLRTPWLGRPFVGLENYSTALTDGRFWGALLHTAIFTLGSVSLEILFGLLLALVLNRAFRGRGVVRAAVLVPWAIPTVVAALLWRFLFDNQAGVANAIAGGLGLIEEPFIWFLDATAAWVPVILADVWKTTPFVALLLLAGLQGIDESLYESARLDGASPAQEFFYITLPLLKPTLLVVLLFRTLDALRVFDLIYVLTGGGPGVATEPIALYTFTTLLQDLQFGYGAALSVLIALIAGLIALLYVRLLRAAPERG